jgi:hypothetical protein
MKGGGLHCPFFLCDCLLLTGIAYCQLNTPGMPLRSEHPGGVCKQAVPLRSKQWCSRWLACVAHRAPR